MGVSMKWTWKQHGTEGRDVAFLFEHDGHKRAFAFCDCGTVLNVVCGNADAQVNYDPGIVYTYATYGGAMHVHYVLCEHDMFVYDGLHMTRLGARA